MTLLLMILMAVIISQSSSSDTTNVTSQENQDLTIATQEMQKANYFTFVLLIQMAPPNSIKGNITFLMPNDKTLSKIDIDSDYSSIADFLLRHSIPSPLLIDHLERFPTGSMVPTSEPRFMFRVTNNGRRQFFLSNVRIVSPNICMEGNSIRCHGVDGVVEPVMISPPPPPLSCASNRTSTPMAAAPAAEPSPSAGGGSVVDFEAPIPSVVAVGAKKSGCNRRVGRHGGIIDLIMAFFLLVVMKLC